MVNSLSKNARFGGKSPEIQLDTLGINGLTFLVSDEERLERFMLASGFDPSSIKQHMKEPHFFLSILEYIAQDDALMLEFAQSQKIRPESIMAIIQRANYHGE